MGLTIQTAKHWVNTLRYMAEMKRWKLDYFALYWQQIFLPLPSCGKGIRVSSGALDPCKQWYVRTHKRDVWYMWLTDFAKTEVPIPDPSHYIFRKKKLELWNDRGYYMPARGYEYFLLVFKSISHSFALAALTRLEHEKIKISIHKRTCNILHVQFVFWTSTCALRR